MSNEDRVLTKVLRVENGYCAERIMTEFPRETDILFMWIIWKPQIDTTGSADRKRKSGSGRRRIACTVTSDESVWTFYETIRHSII